MNKENELLDCISQNEQISQRELAGLTGLSLGNVNLLIKKMVKTGLIKIERLTPHTLRYILTPKGLAEKSQKTYDYIINAVKYILKVKNVMGNILNTYIREKNYQVYLYGIQDEVYEIISQIVNESNYTNVEYISELNVRPIQPEATLLIVWEPEKEQEATQNGLECINILYLI